jgi:hypothetical protein
MRQAINSAVSFYNAGVVTRNHRIGSCIPWLTPLTNLCFFSIRQKDRKFPIYQKHHCCNQVIFSTFAQFGKILTISKGLKRLLLFVTLKLKKSL